MVSTWNIRPGQGDGDPGSGSSDSEDAGSLAPGANLDRRRFVEFAVGAVAGVALVGLPAPASADVAIEGRPVDDPCSGKGLGGPPAEVLEYEDLVGLHRAAIDQDER